MSEDEEQDSPGNLSDRDERLTRLMEVARRMGIKAIERDPDTGPELARLCLRAAMKLSRDEFEVSGLDDEAIESAIVDEGWRILARDERGRGGPGS